MPDAKTILTASPIPVENWGRPPGCPRTTWTGWRLSSRTCIQKPLPEWSNRHGSEFPLWRLKSLNGQLSPQDYTTLKMYYTVSILLQSFI